MQTPNFSYLFKEQDKKSPQQQQPSAEEYTWSTMRVVEQVTINVSSAVIIGFLALLGAVVGSFFLWLFHIIPANWLLVVIAIPVGMAVMLLALPLIGWLVFRKMPPSVILGMLIGAAIGSMLGAAAEASKKKKAGVDAPEPKKNTQE